MDLEMETMMAENIEHSTAELNEQATHDDSQWDAYYIYKEEQK